MILLLPKVNNILILFTCFNILLFCNNIFSANPTYTTGNTENKLNSKEPVIGNYNKILDLNPQTLREQISDDELNSKPVPNTNPKQTEPPIGRDYIQKWNITSARTTEIGSVDNFDMLSPDSYFLFYSHNKIKFRLNKNYPEQTGTYSQTTNKIIIVTNNENECTNCIKEFSITRENEKDIVFKLSFNNSSQFFTVDIIK